MHLSNIPSVAAFNALSRYADLLAEFGPDSTEARQFFEENRNLTGFEENATNLYRLEKEDYEERNSSHTRKT